MDSFKEGSVGEFAKPTTEQLEQYKVPFGPMVLAGLATSLQIACLVITFAWLTSALLPSLVGPLPVWLPYVLAAMAFLGYCRTWWFAQAYRYDSTYVEYGEYVVISLASFGLFSVTGWTGGGLAFVLAVSFVTSWAIGRTWLNQIFRLYDQPYDLFAKQGRYIVSNGEQARFFDQNLAYKFVTQRLRLAFGLAALTVTWAASHESRGVEIPAMATVVYVLVSIGLIGWARQRFLRTSWQQEKVINQTRLNRRWLAYFVILIVLAILPTFFLPSGPNETLGTLLRQLFQSDQPPPNTDNIFGKQNDGFQQQVDRNRAERQNPDQFSLNLPDWAVIGIGVLTTALVIWLTIYFLGKAGWAGPKLKDIKLRQYAIATASWFKNLPSAIAAFFKAMFSKDDTDYGEPREEKPSRPSLLSRFRRPKVPAEAREQIRYYYQYMSLRAGKAGLARKNGQTPAEYADFLQPQAPDLAPDLSDLTQLYHEARFSPHPIEPSQADRAKSEASRLADHFRKSKKF